MSYELYVMSYEFWWCDPESQCKDNTWGGADVLECPPMSLDVL